MDRVRRRAFLAGCGAVVTGLAGCQGAPGDGPADGGDATDGSADGNESARGDGRVTLETVDVAGSPGTEMVVNPAGEVALLDFFATWCAPCKPQMAELRAVRDSYPDLHMLSVTWERDAAAVADFWEEYEGTWPVATDPEIRTGPAFDVERLPTLVLVDADGAEAWRDVGLSEAETIGEQVEAVL